MTKWDVAIAGAGPAGIACALTLSRAGRRVVIVDKAPSRMNHSETLAPRAMEIVSHILPDLSPLGDAVAQARGVIADWGDGPQVHDYFYTPAGNGICVDRQGFDTRLLGVARSEGAVVNSGPITELAKPGAAWRLAVGGAEISADFVVDATGRRSVLAAMQGLDRIKDDPLFAFALRFSGGPRDGFARIKACGYGWWYLNGVPGTHETVAVLHTDKDLPEAKQAATLDGFLELLPGSGIADQLGKPIGKIRGAPAGSERLSGGWPEGFIAVGDAAQAFDPLSSQGLEYALRSGVLAGQMLNFALANPRDQEHFLDRYKADLARKWAKYTEEYAHYYGIGPREHPFWQRRRADLKHKDLARDAL